VRSPYGYYCITVIAACQEIFLCYTYSSMADKENSGTDINKAQNGDVEIKAVEPIYASAAKPASEAELNEVKTEMNAFERSTLKWARTAVILSGLAALFVCLQWIEMRSSGTDTHDLAVAAKTQAENIGKQIPELQKTAKATEDAVAFARKNARLDQRPWLGISFGTQSFNVGDEVAEQFHVVDTGRTPALNVHGMAVTLFVRKGEVLNFSYDHGTKIEMGTMLPNAPQDAISVLIPSGVPKTTKITPLKWTKEMSDGLRAGDGYVVVYGMLNYTSIFGANHWIRFCAPSTTMRFNQQECTAYNDVDKKEE